MTRRVPCPPAPGPLEEYAARFDDLFGSLAQRRGFREYMAGLLAPRDRNKTLTALAGAGPVTGAQHPAAQRLQFFLSESRWDPDLVNARRLELLRADPATAPHGGGVLVIDVSGDRKDTARQRSARHGKTGNGTATITTLWADERACYPVHAVPCTPAPHPAKENHPGFRTRPQTAADLAAQAKTAGFCFRAVAAGSEYGGQDEFPAALEQAGLPFVIALNPHRGTRAHRDDAHTPVDAARALAWNGPDDSGDWQPVTRTFPGGHTQTWQAAEATPGRPGPDSTLRLIVVTADPATLPDKATWYLATSLPRPGGEAASPHPAADLAEITRIHAIRHRTRQTYKQARDELGWDDFQVRSGIAIRRHQALVNCAFSFCQDTRPAHPATPPAPQAGSGDKDPGHDRCQCDAGHLTSRQIDVLRAIAHDLSTRLIAEKLKISENTVNTHIKAMKKLAGVSKARHLLALAVSQQIIDMSAHPPRWTGITCIRPRPQHRPATAG